MQKVKVCLIAALVFGMAGTCAVRAGAHKDYVKKSDDFSKVSQSKEILQNSRWNVWVYMPWRYSWGKPYDKALAEEIKSFGFNGGFCDHMPDEDAKIQEELGLLWYLDHAAGKGTLHLNGSGDRLRAMPNRASCLVDPKVVERLKLKLGASVPRAKKYKTRIAYALDDEISWSLFTSPCKYDNSPLSLNDFGRWLSERYANEEALKKEWRDETADSSAETVKWGDWKSGTPPDGYISKMVNPDSLLSLRYAPMNKWNLSPFCDAISYMDSQINNLVGNLVRHSNSLDPETPVGYVGGQSPAPYGGFDYAKVTRKIQFLEAYDIGGSMEITRSLNPDNMIPTVKTAFGPPESDDLCWLYWYYLAHGDRGVISWADGWFNSESEVKVPAEKLKEAGKLVAEVAGKSKLFIGGKWMHDKVGIYYSHPSVQVSWFIDSVIHGETWIKRSSSMNNDFASWIGTAWSWQKILEDKNIQYNWVSYADALEKGIDPKEYSLLILPQVLSLSKDEAEVLEKYVADGGHIIADNLTGIFDEHGKAYADGKGMLDDLFGIAKRPAIVKGSLFAGGKDYTEIDSESYYDEKNFVGAGAKAWPSCKRDKGLVVAQRDMKCFESKKTGKGVATHMNISVIEYCKVRRDDFAGTEKYIAPVTELIEKAGVKNRISLSLDGKKAAISEAVYWKNNGRVIVAVVKNPLKMAAVDKQTATEGISKEIVQLKISFDSKKSGLRDEMSGKELGDQSSVTVPWQLSKCAIVSYKE